jgi:hypothetical protein
MISGDDLAVPMDFVLGVMDARVDVAGSDEEKGVAEGTIATNKAIARARRHALAQMGVMICIF